MSDRTYVLRVFSFCIVLAAIGLALL